MTANSTVDRISYKSISRQATPPKLSTQKEVSTPMVKLELHEKSLVDLSLKKRDKSTENMHLDSPALVENPDYK